MNLRSTTSVVATGRVKNARTEYTALCVYRVIEEGNITNTLRKDVLETAGLGTIQSRNNIFLSLGSSKEGIVCQLLFIAELSAPGND